MIFSVTPIRGTINPEISDSVHNYFVYYAFEIVEEDDINRVLEENIELYPLAFSPIHLVWCHTFHNGFIPSTLKACETITPRSANMQAIDRMLAIQGAL